MPAKLWGSPFLGDTFFRASHRGKCVGERLFLGSAVNNRLRVYLFEAKFCAGETPHSFRVGLSNTLTFWAVFLVR